MIFRNSVFKTPNVQMWTVSNCKGVYLLIVRKGIFRLRNVQIRAIPSFKRINFLMLRNSFSWCEILKYLQCCPAMRLIC